MYSNNLIFDFVLILLIVLINEYLFYFSFKRFLIRKNSKVFFIKSFQIFTNAFVVLFISFDVLNYFFAGNKYISLVYNILCIWAMPKLILFPLFFIGNLFAFAKNIFYKNKKEYKKTYSNRRQLLNNIFWGVATIPVLSAAWGFFNSSTDIRRRFFNISINNLPEVLSGFRIVHISDLHFGSFSSTSAFDKLCDIINFELKPDLIFITGDFVNYSESEVYKYKLNLLNLRARYGKFAVFGNHDNYSNLDILNNLLEESGVRVLQNESFILNTIALPLQIVGVTDSPTDIEMQNNILKAFKEVNKNEPCFFLCHNPKYWKKYIYSKQPANITFSGHMHGAVLALPFTDGKISLAPIVSKLTNTDEISGLYKKNSQYLYVNRGFGTTMLNLRIGVMPEVAIFDLDKIENLV